MTDAVAFVLGSGVHEDAEALRKRRRGRALVVIGGAFFVCGRPPALCCLLSLRLPLVALARAFGSRTY